MGDARKSRGLHLPRCCRLTTPLFGARRDLTRQPAACAHQLAKSRTLTPWASAHAVAFFLDARYASTAARNISTRSLSNAISDPIVTAMSASFCGSPSTGKVGWRNGYTALALILASSDLMNLTDNTTWLKISWLSY